MDDELFSYNNGDVMFFRSLKDIPKNENGVVDLNAVLLFVCLHGSLQLHMNGEVYEVEQSHCLVSLPHAAISHIMVSPEAELGVLGFALTAMDNVFYTQRDVWNHVFQLTTSPVVSLSDDELQLMGHLYEVARLEVRMSDRAHYRQMIRSLSQSFFYLLVDTITRSLGQNVADEQTSQKDLLFKHFLQLLSASGGKTRSVSDFAQQMCITPKYLATLVREVSGQTPMEWIHRYTANVIAQRLRYSDQSIKEISNDLGFPSISFFGRYVKQQLGCSPRDYRLRVEQTDSTDTNPLPL